MVSKGLWDRAQTICITMMQGETKRSRAERNFSMIQSVVRDGDTFKILALNKMSADILEREYAEDLKKSFLLAGADPNIKIEFSFDENAKPAIIVPKANTVVEKTKTGRIQTFISTMPLKEYYTFEEFKKDIYPILQKEGIKFSSIGSPIGKVGIDDEEGFEKQKKQLAELVKIAQLMECKYIRIFSFYYGDKNPSDCHAKVIAPQRVSRYRKRKRS